ncbi:MAG: hypothetical protein ACW981_02595 [Candidatus Hodarchaeales archaeon]|jgi:hypothetical protein
MNEPFLIKNEISIQNFQDNFVNLKKKLITYYSQLIEQFEKFKPKNNVFKEKILTLPRELLIFEFKDRLILRIEDHYTPWGREISFNDVNFDYYSIETCLEIVQIVEKLFHKVNAF